MSDSSVSMAHCLLRETREIAKMAMKVTHQLAEISDRLMELGSQSLVLSQTLTFAPEIPVASETEIRDNTDAATSEGPDVAEPPSTAGAVQSNPPALLTVPAPSEPDLPDSYEITLDRYAETGWNAWRLGEDLGIGPASVIENMRVASMHRDPRYLAGIDKALQASRPAKPAPLTDSAPRVPRRVVDRVPTIEPDESLIGLSICDVNFAHGSVLGPFGEAHMRGQQLRVVARLAGQERVGADDLRALAGYATDATMMRELAGINDALFPTGLRITWLDEAQAVQLRRVAGEEA